MSALLVHSFPHPTNTCYLLSAALSSGDTAMNLNRPNFLPHGAFNPVQGRGRQAIKIAIINK